MFETIINSLNTSVAGASTLQLNFFGGVILAVSVIGIAAILTWYNNSNKEQAMLPNISPDSYIYLKLALAGLFTLSLVYVFGETKNKYFKDYGKIERKKDDK